MCSLTLGLMGLDELHLRVLAASSDNPKEKVNARKGMPHVACQCSPLMNALIVLNIMQKGRHWVLVVCSRHIEYNWRCCLGSRLGAPSRQCRRSILLFLGTIGYQIPLRLSTKVCRFFSTVPCVPCNIRSSFIETWSIDWWRCSCDRDFYRRYWCVVPNTMDPVHALTLV